MKKCLTVMVATIGLLSATAAADATQWYYNRQPIPQGVVQETISRTNKEVVLSLKPHEAPPIKLSCSIEGVTALWNGPKTGYGEVRSTSFACTSPAGKVTVTPHGTWTSELTGTKLPLTDTWSGVELEVTVAGTDYGMFTGSLAPRMGDKDPVGARDNHEGRGDDLDTLLFFYGDRLAGPNGASLGLTGWYGLGSKSGQGATGEVR